MARNRNNNCEIANYAAYPTDVNCATRPKSFGSSCKLYSDCLPGSSLQCISGTCLLNTFNI